ALLACVHRRGELARVDDGPLGGPTTTSGSDREVHPLELLNRVRVRVRDQRRTAFDGLADPGVWQVESLRTSVHFDPCAGLERGVEPCCLRQTGLDALRRQSVRHAEAR